MKSGQEKWAGKGFVLEPIWRSVYAKLEEQLPSRAMEEWVDHLRLVKLTRRKAVVRFSSDGDLEEFLWLYKDVFSRCLQETLGYRVKIRFKRVTGSQRRRRHRVKRAVLVLLSLVLLAMAAGAVVLGCSYLANQDFRETFYQTASGKVGEGLRIIQISDLHGTDFGGGNQELVRRIELLAPDLIVMTGDCVEQDDPDWDVTLELCRQLTELAPVCYIYGNDEQQRMYGCKMTLSDIDDLLNCGEDNRDASKFRELDDDLRDDLEAAGVHVLLNETVTLELRGVPVDIYGVLTANPSAFWPYAGESYGAFAEENPGHFKLMLCHEPYLFEEFRGGQWADLVLCGHTHGGVVRLPYVGGVYETSHGLFPELGNVSGDESLIYGQYTVDATPIIVSSGLSNRGVIRVNNRPELVVVDVSRY